MTTRRRLGRRSWIRIREFAIRDDTKIGGSGRVVWRLARLWFRLGLLGRTDSHGVLIFGHFEINFTYSCINASSWDTSAIDMPPLHFQVNSFDAKRDSDFR